MSLSLSIAFLYSNAENLIETKQLFFFPKDLIKLMCTGKPSIQISQLGKISKPSGIFKRQYKLSSSLDKGTTVCYVCEITFQIEHELSNDN